MFKDIEKMLDEGMTPEKLYQEALRIVEAKNAAAAKANKEKIDKARGELIAAISNYTETVTGKEVDKKFLEDTKKILLSIEESAPSKPATKRKECKCKRELTDDEKLAIFLKPIGVLD